MAFKHEGGYALSWIDPSNIYIGDYLEGTWMTIVSSIYPNYSTSNLTEQDFNSRLNPALDLFDKGKYESIRKKYHAQNNFMDIYDKINYRNKVKKNDLRSKLFTFFGKKYLKQINNNKDKLIR